MIAKDSFEYSAQSSDNLSIDNVPVAIGLSTTPLARNHISQKHYYQSADHSHSSHSSNNIDNVDEIYIDSKSVSLAVEAAIAIIINGIHYAVLMASPSQLDYLAIGFLFSEGLIYHSHDLLDWEVTQIKDNASFKKFTENSFEQLSEQLLDYDIYIVELVLNQRCHQRIQAQKRQLAGRTGCGMCGITGLTQALPDLSSYLKNKHNIMEKAPSLNSLLKVRAEINAMQHTHQLTGAVHAAAAMYENQLYLFEDVGRHNALDKLIGWQLRHKIDVECVVMTSRLSIELVQKSIRTQIPWLVGMSAPTSTAVRVAQRYGLGLAGFLRGNRVTYYSGI